jgi:hypothetical protein
MDKPPRADRPSGLFSWRAALLLKCLKTQIRVVDHIPSDWTGLTLTLGSRLPWFFRVAGRVGVKNASQDRRRTQVCPRHARGRA